MITLGLVADVDADGIYVTLPGSRGVLRGPFETLQNVVAGDKVLVVTTDDGDCVVVGLAAAAVAGVVDTAMLADGSVTSAKIANGTIVNEDISGSAAIDRSKISGLPTSSTDNTVARFDGATGALQGSSVVIDDSNNVTGVADFTTNKASNFWRLNCTSGNGNVYYDVAAGAQMAVMYRTAGSNRWFVGKTSTAESGSNAGSNFLIYAYNDTGGGIGNCFEINRSTRRVTISNAATTAGLELGASGPTITSGTGAPSHSATNGSLYLRTDGGAGTTLYVREAGAWAAK